MGENEQFKKILKTVGNNLRAIRIAKEDDIATVANAIKISPLLLQKIEKGEYDMEICLLFDICHYYNTAPNEVFEERA